MLRLKGECRAESDSTRTTTANLNTDIAQLANDLVAHRTVDDVDSNKRTHAASVEKHRGVVDRHGLDGVEQELASNLHALEKVVILHRVHDSLELHELGGVTHPSVENAVRLLGTEVVGVVEAVRDRVERGNKAEEIRDEK